MLTPVESQGQDAVVPETVGVQMVCPSTERLNRFDVPEAPLTDIWTVIVPETVAPACGEVIEAVSDPGLSTVTVTGVAKATVLAESVTLAVSVWEPLATRVVFQLVVGLLPE